MSDTAEKQFGELTVHIDRLMCAAFESCVDIAPEVFILDDDQVSSFKDGEEITVDRDKLIDACASCPVDALSVYDSDGEQLVP